jgi:hypothetical protein
MLCVPSDDCQDVVENRMAGVINKLDTTALRPILRLVSNENVHVLLMVGLPMPLYFDRK